MSILNESGADPPHDDSALRQASAGLVDAPRTPIVMAERALDWLTVNLDRFEPFQGQLKPIWRKNKALVELALITMSLRRQTVFADDIRVGRILDLILLTYRHPVYREMAFHQESDFAADAFVPLALHACNLLHDEDDWQALQNLIDHSNLLLTSRAPHKTLELIYLLDMGGFNYHLQSPIAYLRRVLNPTIDLIWITREYSYVVTHTIFYLSEFGARIDFSIPEKQRQHLSWLVEQLLGLYLRDENWDLVGELLTCCHCLRQTDSPLYAIGWQAYLAAQRSDGAVPGPDYDPNRLDALAVDQRPEYLFQQCYHSTLVAALAGALVQDNGAVDGEQA